MSSPAQRRSAPARTGKQRTTEPPRLTWRQFDFEASTSSTSATQLTLKQIRDHTYPQLTPVDAFRRRDRAQHTHARPFGDDFVELLVHRDGEHIRPLTDDHVAQVGATELFELARERLRLLPTNGCQLIRRDRSEFHVLRGDCVLTASKLLVLPDVVGPILGRARTRSAGVLVSVPSRRELVFADVNENIAANLVHLARPLAARLTPTGLRNWIRRRALGRQF